MNEHKNDPVNNPKHYTDGCSVECIDMMQTALGWDGVIYFCLGNAYKYLWRHKIKNNPEEDLAKAKWYIDRAVVMAQDDREDYGYLLSMAEPLMRLVETYTILHQSIKAMENLDDSSFYPDSLETETFKFRSKNDIDDHKEIIDFFKRVLNSFYGIKNFGTEETKSDKKHEDKPDSLRYIVKAITEDKEIDPEMFAQFLKKFDIPEEIKFKGGWKEDDWAFVSADAEFIYNILNSKEVRDGHVTVVDRSVVIGALDRILERCKKHQKEDKYEL